MISPPLKVKFEISSDWKKNLFLSDVWMGF